MAAAHRFANVLIPTANLKDSPACVHLPRGAVAGVHHIVLHQVGGGHTAAVWFVLGLGLGFITLKP